MTEKLILYGTPSCSMVPPVRGMLNRAGITYEYVSLSNNAEAKERVRQINNGYESVPTLVFADGSTLTEPPLKQLKEKLRTLGYEVRSPTLIEIIQENPFIALISGGMLIFGLVDRNWVFLVLSVGLLLFVLIRGKLTG